MSQQTLTMNSSKNIAIKKNFYQKNLDKLQHMLDLIILKDNVLQESIKNVDSNNPGGLEGMHLDIERSHVTSKMNEQMKELIALKQQIIQKVLLIRGKHETLTLESDRILFDNSIMIDTVYKNIQMLIEISKYD